MVICGKPSAGDSAGSAAPPPEDAKLQAVRTVELPLWGKLNAESSWREFAAAGSNPDVVKQVSLFKPQVRIHTPRRGMPLMQT